MPALTIDQPAPSQSETASASPLGLPALSIAPSSVTDAASNPPGSPVAPEYSPITPKVQPAIPATLYDPENGVDNRIHPDLAARPDQGQHENHQSNSQDPVKAAPPAPPKPAANFIPPPPPQPFSNEDSTDAIALRAAISALQFQKKKAQDDVRALETVRKQALASPEHFKSELAAGRMNEQRRKVGDLNSILDHSDSDSSDDEEEDSDADKKETESGAMETSDLRTEIPDSQASQTQMESRKVSPSGSEKSPASSSSPPPAAKTFNKIPGPQNVVRMPPINWAKYHIVGEPLDSLHEQQKRWPGSHASFSSDRGREHSVASPYSPFMDHLDGGGDASLLLDGGLRKDSVATPYGISEHPMETRRSSSKYH